MLNSAQKTMLLAFGRIIANIDCYVECSSCFYKSTEHVRVRVSDREASYVDLEGIGSTLNEAFDNVVRAFEAHPMGCKRSSVEVWIAAGCPEGVEAGSEEQPDTIREPIIMDSSPEAFILSSDQAVALPDSYDVDLTDLVGAVRPAPKRVQGGAMAKEMVPGPHRRWVKETNQRHERRRVRSLLRNGMGE